MSATEAASRPQPRRAGASRVLKAGALPGPMVAALGSAGVTADGLLAAFPADLSPAGKFAERWLVVARDRLAVVAGAPGAAQFKVQAQEPFKGLTGMDYRAMVGGGLVLARRGQDQRELVRCSRAADRGIQAGLAKLRAHLGLERPPEPDKKDAKAPPAPAGEEKVSDTLAVKASDPSSSPKAPPPEARPELTDEEVRIFLGQLDELGEQLYCPKCGLALKQDSSVCPVCVSSGQTLMRVLKLALPYRRQLALLCVLMAAMTLLSIAPPYIYGRLIVDRTLTAAPGVSAEGRLRWLFLLVALAFLVNLFSNLLRVWQGRAAVGVGGRVARDLRGQVFNHLQILSLAYFDRHKTGALMTRVSQDTRMLEGFLVDGVQWTVISSLQAVMIAAILFAMDWKLALLVVLPAPLVVIFTRLMWKRIMARFRRLWEVISRLSAVLNDSLRGIRVVKAFGREEQEISRFGRYNEACFDALLAAEKTWTTLTPFLQLIIMLGSFLVWMVGGTDVIGKAMSLGTLLTFAFYMPMMYGPLQIMTRINDWLTRSMTAAERIFEILDTRPQVAEHPEAVAMPRMAGGIELCDVTFGYEKHTPVIKRASFKITAGEMIGLVGPSGAGKSTTINLITRLYDVDEGRILIDGVDIRKIRLEDLRRQTGVVLQETFLFSGTVLENIAYARSDAEREEIIAAARLANAHDFIMERPDGYDSEVEEGGGNFSAGEKQRLAIARAILHDPRILILDEATSSVDTKTEQQIQEAITRLTEGRTTIAIAHRLSTLRGANRLVILDKGEVKEVGTHEELVAREGIYHDLVKAHSELCSVIAVEG